MSECKVERQSVHPIVDVLLHTFCAAARGLIHGDMMATCAAAAASLNLPIERSP